MPDESRAAGSRRSEDPPRVVASDLDGTLLRSDGTLSSRTAAAWRAVEEAGIVTVLVTARPPRWLDALSELIASHGLAICGNGAFLYDVGRRRVIGSQGFDRADLLAVVADLRAAVPGITFAAERASGPWVEPAYPDPHRERGADTWVRAPLEDIDEEPVGKLLALAPTLSTDDLLRRVGTVVGDRGILAYSGAHALAEVNAPGVTKAAALETWCAERGIGPAQVWAFGDMPNDIPMLSWAGRSYAVASGHGAALAAATDTCPANDEDGVAQVLERLVASVAGIPVR
ncbi:HAD-superfamily hydrolase, subfamily IIB [Nostocoides japonicum T1-X7]|uniref:HAD-superfamily hydrolase, subfamily IIB n=1 Tax=Nostocoides japonicum T1-X7 TaxID=1194083 RepID=A0A077M0U2_9MICO|nr:HAD family hydrolase [Tetrasphaera japonica]CCH79943.1 HAD-superfamily hydrolase, subfamily IIB [Tetrasphaera japonica T1-X7]